MRTWKIRTIDRHGNKDFMRIWRGGLVQKEHKVFYCQAEAERTCSNVRMICRGEERADVVTVWQKPAVTELHGPTEFHTRLNAEGHAWIYPER